MSQQRGMVCIIPDAFSARILGGHFFIFTARVSSDGSACNTVLGSLCIQLVHFYAPWQKTQGMARGQFFRKAALSKTMADKADTPHSKLQQKNASTPGLFHRRCAPGLSVGCPCNLQRLAKCHSEVEMS